MAQAKAGKVAYESSCGICHLNSLRGRVGIAGELPDPDTLPRNYQETINGNAGQVPALAGEEFLAKWGSKTAGEFAVRVLSASGAFPPKGADDSTFLAVTAYILQSNGARAGNQALTTTTAIPVNATVAKARPRKP
ncbi:MAG: hypothetical protein WDO68_04760 [Gammaproteobacteria bacterium]